MAKAATALDVEVAAVKAVREVEAKGTGFWGTRAAILFERLLETADGHRARASRF